MGVNLILQKCWFPQPHQRKCMYCGELIVDRPILFQNHYHDPMLLSRAASLVSLPSYRSAWRASYLEHQALLRGRVLAIPIQHRHEQSCYHYSLPPLFVTPRYQESTMDHDSCFKEVFFSAAISLFLKLAFQARSLRISQIYLLRLWGNDLGIFHNNEGNSDITKGFQMFPRVICWALESPSSAAASKYTPARVLLGRVSSAPKRWR